MWKRFGTNPIIFDTSYSYSLNHSVTQQCYEPANGDLYLIAREEDDSLRLKIWSAWGMTKEYWERNEEQGWNTGGANRSSGAATPAAAAVCVLQPLWFHGYMVSSILTNMLCRTRTCFCKFCHWSHKGGRSRWCRQSCCSSGRCSRSVNHGATAGFKGFVPHVFQCKCFKFI